MSPAQGRLILIVAAVAFALAATAPAAQAKGIRQASVCGADGCVDVTSRLQGPRDCTDCSAEQLMSALSGSAHPSRQAPYVRIVLGFGHPDQGGVEARERILYSSELRLGARQEGPDEWAWFRLPPAALAVAVRLTRDITPYPAASMPIGPKLTGTLVPAPAADARSAPAASGDSSATTLLLPGGAIVAAVAAFAAVAVRRRQRTA